jgi:hypothetical protein
VNDPAHGCGIDFEEIGHFGLALLTGEDEAGDFGFLFGSEAAGTVAVFAAGLCSAVPWSVRR